MMASPRLSRSPSYPGKLRGYSEYNLRTSVKLQRTRIDLENEVARLEEQAARNMASHRAALRKIEAIMQRRHHRSTSPESHDAGSDDEAYLSADSPGLRRVHSSNTINRLVDSPNLAHQRSSSFSCLWQDTPPVTKPTVRRAGSVGKEKTTGKRATIPEIRISVEQPDAASTRRRFTAPNTVLSEVAKKKAKTESEQTSQDFKPLVSLSRSPPTSRSASPSPPGSPIQLSLDSPSSLPPTEDFFPVNHVPRSGGRARSLPTYHRSTSESSLRRNQVQRASDSVVHLSALRVVSGCLASKSFSDIKSAGNLSPQLMRTSASTSNLGRIIDEV